MIEFLHLLCNGQENPACVDTYPIIFNWNFAPNYERGIMQESFTFELRNKNTLLFSKELHTKCMQFSCEKEYLRPLCDYTWNVTIHFSDGSCLCSSVQSFSTGFLGNRFSDYHADWITGSKAYDRQAIVFCKRFSILKPVRMARAYIFASAWQKVQIDDRYLREDCFLLPPNSPYSQKCIYECYDLGDLHLGVHQIRVLLGGGYNSNYSQWGWRWLHGKGLYALIRIEYEDDTLETVVSDASWEIWDSAISECDIYDGEIYNANHKSQFVEMARICSCAPTGIFTADEMPSICVIKTLEPIRCNRYGSSWLFDLGYNTAGFAQISLIAPKGHVITLQYSEMLRPDGRLDTTTNCLAKARDTYICNGVGVETYAPSFTYHGYRYVEVTGLTSDVRNFSLIGIVLCSDIQSKSFFRCSDVVINRIHDNCVRSMQSNFMSIPTDCAMRNERTPCLMDSQCVECSAIYNFNMYSYYCKWLDDILIAYDDIDDHCNPDWDGDKIALAWKLLRFFNDTRIARKYYQYLKSYVENLEKASSDMLWHEGFGDWCHPNENTWESFHGSVSIVNSCLFYSECVQLSEIAQHLGEEEDSSYFFDVAQKVQAAFLERYLHCDGQIHNGTQTEQLMPLYVGILPHEKRLPVWKCFKDKIKNGQLDLGIYGITALAKVVSEFHESNLLYEILHRPNYPGYLYQIANGATTLWEQWAYTGRMHSHNHSMFAGIDAAFYYSIAGIRPIENSFSSFEIHPNIPDLISWFECAVETIAGIIRVSYNKMEGIQELQVLVPANTYCRVFFPKYSLQSLLFDGEVILGKENLENDFVELKSGCYCFRFINRNICFDATITHTDTESN